ncbi:competence type IV pilus ATPase ComGA [Ligilactobacillus faecis]|uniref:Competence type IV pilus ATPase ComGA n=1 Tax=Ligilactobacillus faecis TaxID=762833 RepID=A0ABV4DRQ8_9LACO
MRLADELLQQAFAKQAGDILLLPGGKDYIVKFFCQGTYQMITKLKKASAQQMIAYFKFQANMMLSEQRRPQLGALTVTLAGNEIFLRLSTVGDFLGRESLVIRLIYPLERATKNFLDLKQWSRLENVCQKKGLVLLAGPMGSGKTTTMYQLAKKLTDQQVMCIEDPVEIKDDSFLQLEVNEPAQMSYEILLKAALRHHPDIFIIGEIRDTQTAHIALTAALSGHLVLSTVHAMSATGILTRLEDLGLSKKDVLQVTQCFSYQRLLPLKDGTQAVLFDLIFKQEFETVFRSEMTMTKEWRDELERSVAEGKITKRTKQAFLEG